MFTAGEGVSGVGVTLYADANCDSVADGAALLTQDTLTDGAYLFDGLAVGPPGGPALCYLVEVDGTDIDLGTCTVARTALSYNPALEANTPDALQNDFAFEEQPRYTLGDLVWYDTNRDGMQDVSEPGVENINVELFTSADCSIGSLGVDSTDAGGFYEFTNLLADTYSLQFTNLPAGWVISLADQGADETLDSDADPSSGCIGNIVLGADDPDEDVGVYQPGGIGDTVWCDGVFGAGDGLFNAGEGLAGVTVNLFADSDCDAVADSVTPDQTQETTGDGQYLFTDLLVGPSLGPSICYVVQVDTSDVDLGSCDVAITVEERPVDLTAGAAGNALDEDFGFQEQERFSVGDFVWFDVNQNGIQDTMEPGVESIDVTLYDDAACTGTVLGTTTTDASGGYGFTDLLAGTYCVEFSAIPATWTISAPGQGADELLDSDADPTSAQIQSIVLGPNDFSADMGVYVAGRIGDTVWCDGANGAGDGVFSAGEGLSDITVNLFEDSDCDNIADGAAVQTQSSGVDGAYLFTDLWVGAPTGPALCYVVSVDASDPQLATCDLAVTVNEYAPDLDANAPDSLDNDFGFQEQPLFSLGDLVFFDIDGDGIQDAGETGVGSIDVTLYSGTGCTGAMLDATTTDGSGNYGFVSLLAGTYSVEFTALPAGWTISPASQGGDATRDSDANPTTGCIDSVVLGPNTFDQDLGVSVSGRIGDTVWCDGANGTGDGVFSAGEGLANVSVSLFADSDCDDVADGAALASQDTGVDGAYLFSGLPSVRPVARVVLRGAAGWHGPGSGQLRCASDGVVLRAGSAGGNTG